MCEDLYMKKLKFLLFITLNMLFVASIEGSTELTPPKLSADETLPKYEGPIPAARPVLLKYEISLPEERPALPKYEGPLLAERPDLSLSPLPRYEAPRALPPKLPLYEFTPPPLKEPIEHKRWSTSFNLLTPKQWGLATTSVVAACLMSYVYAYSQASEKDAKFVAETYPHAQAWYNDLACKYPQLRLNEKQFLQGTLVSDQFMRWNYFYNQIYCHKAVLEALDVICKKRTKKQALLHDEVTFLAIQEFAVLLQVGHIENNHVVKTRIYTIGVVMALEIIKIWYKEFELHRISNDDWEKGLPTASVLFTEWLLVCLLEIPLMQYQYFASYAFACKHADIATLELVASFFERYLHGKHVASYLSHWNNQFYNDKAEYMQPEARSKMIRNAIECRLENKE
jgi:hypothetical protein